MLLPEVLRPEFELGRVDVPELREDLDDPEEPDQLLLREEDELPFVLLRVDELLRVDDPELPHDERELLVGVVREGVFP